MKIRKILFVVTAILMLASVVFSQGTFKPRDADEEHGWRLYNQYKASKKKEADLNKRIAQLRSDIQNASHSSIGGLGADPSDVAAKNKALEELKTEQTKQKNLEAAWQKKFYWRYGDLKDSDKMIYDPKTKQNMDKIQFALIYFPFDPKTNIDAPVSDSAPSTSLKLESPGYWGHLSYTITGARLNPPSGGDSGKVAGRQYTGELVSNTLMVSGTAVSDNPSSGPGSMDYYELKVSVSVGKETKNYSYIAPKGEKLNKSFSFSVPVESGAAGSFSISLLEQNANYGPHGWVVGGSMSPLKSGVVKINPSSPTAINNNKGSFSTINGQVSVSNDGKNWNSANVQSKLKTGNQIKTGANSSAKFDLNEVVLILGGNSWLGVINDSKTSPSLKLFGGNVKISLPKGNNLKVEMSQAIATVRGTNFELSENGERSVVKVTEGVVEFRNKTSGATTNVSAGQTFVSTKDGLGAIVGNPPREALAEKTIFSTANDYGVLNGGTPPSFLLKIPITVNYIMTYHWNNGQGTAGGTIALKDNKGVIYGPWKVTVRNKVYWEANPNVKLLPGTYQVIDSDPSTWAHNPQSGGKGMTIIKGFVFPD